MRSETIAQLAWYIPRSETASGLESFQGLRGLTSTQAGDIVHFAECYKNLHIGWDFAATIVDSATPFPAILHGDDLWVWRAYRYIKGNPDGDVQAAASIEAVPGMAKLKGQIRALLLTEKADTGFIASRLGITRAAVEAYEKLFYNVLDRKEDHSFIASIVYPEGRIAEAFEDYVARKDIDALMLRAGYAHGVKHVLYASGIDKKHPYATVGADVGASTMDAMFMADGCLMADFGFAHQKSNAMAIKNARLVMEAGKIGGNKQNGAGVVNFGATLRDEIIKVSMLKAEAQSRQLAMSVKASIPDNSKEAAS